MAFTNTITAQAATETMHGPQRPILLIGVFQGPEGDHILIRNRTGDITRLDAATPLNGLELTETGSGWAMIREGETIHRLVIG